MNEFLGDASVWVALALEPHVHHKVAREWLEGVEQAGSVLFCRATQQSFLRLLTTSALMAPHDIAPLTNESAWATYGALLADPRITLGEEPEGLEPLWRRFASRPSPSPKLWMDAYLAAFALAGGYRLVTTDRGFRQFHGLDVVVLAK
ncbi:MAG: TA system VapC family ribonuclease toxin [Tepidiformaceae bacterium]